MSSLRDTTRDDGSGIGFRRWRVGDQVRMRLLLRGMLAGLAGTAAMTLHQRLRQGRSKGGRPSWDDAPAPAQVARKGLGLIGVSASAERIPLLTNAMHWG